MLGESFGQKQELEGHAHRSGMHERTVWAKKRCASRASFSRLDRFLKRQEPGLACADHEVVLVCISGHYKRCRGSGFCERCKVNMRRDVFLSWLFERVIRAAMPRITR